MIARFCVFDSCQSYGAFSAFRSRGSIRSSYFLNCGRSAIVANDCAKLSINHCEFAQTDRSEQTLSSSQSDVTLNGCYFHAGLLNFEYERNAQAVALTCKSVANITKNYFFRTGNGISVIDADLSASNNLILNCSQNQNHSEDLKIRSTLGLFTGICVKAKGNKVQLVSNDIKNCDIGVYVGQEASPILKNNDILASYFTGVFAECQSRPNMVQNVFNGGCEKLSSKKTTSGKGLGMLLISGSCGLIGKNSFEDYEVSPVMVFSTCHPLLKDNTFLNINIDEEKQKVVEKQMLDQFQAELFQKDEYFYIVESEITEKELQEVILEKKTKK